MRYAILPALLMVLLAGCTAFEAEPPDPPEPPLAPPPNVILIMADDLGYEVLGANGSLSYDTPRLDVLAQTGMRFTACYSTPLCTTTRVQLMTGKYNFRNYIGFGLLDPTERTFGHLLRAAGYRTAVVGKWQLYGNEDQRRLYGRAGTRPAEAGFEDHCVWQVEEGGNRFKDPFLYLHGEPGRSYPGAYGPDVFVDCLKDFVTAHQDEPFFVYYPMVFTHKPFHPTPDHPDYATSDPDAGSDAAYFADNVRYMDALVGRIVDHLDSLGVRENTLLLFTGDNGTNNGIVTQTLGGPVEGGKGLTSERGIHVPLIANWPGTIAPGRVSDALVDFTDFLPTLLEAAGVAPPAGRVLDGLSFYGQLTGTADTTRAWAFCHYAPMWNNIPDRRYVHDHAWKLYEDGRFFDLAADPEETRPLAEGELTPEAQQARTRFRVVLEQLQ